MSRPPAHLLKGGGSIFELVSLAQLQAGPGSRSSRFVHDPQDRGTPTIHPSLDVLYPRRVVPLYLTSLTNPSLYLSLYDNTPFVIQLSLKVNARRVGVTTR